MIKQLSITIISLLILSSFILNKDKHNINIVFIGDSITHGTMAKDQSPPVYAGEYLKLQKNIGNVQIANQGISGFTTVDVLPATKKAYPKVRAAADAFYADQQALLVFSVMLGTNDSAIKGPTGNVIKLRKGSLIGLQ